jgi:hypothetical protein
MAEGRAFDAQMEGDYKSDLITENGCQLWVEE